jgi:hypothetical protein
VHSHVWKLLLGIFHSATDAEGPSSVLVNGGHILIKFFSIFMAELRGDLIFSLKIARKIC